MMTKGGPSNDAMALHLLSDTPRPERPMSSVQILQNAGTYEVLTPLPFLLQQPLIIERAGRTCYQSEKGEITAESAERFAKMLIRRGHESVLEHSSLTVLFRLHSRGLTHELVRHRLTSPSQESTRYVDYDLEDGAVKVVCPPHQETDVFIEIVQRAIDGYEKLRESGWPPEDARQALPIGLKSEIVVTANLREWRHIFHMRCDKPAHWEIRRTMVMLLQHLQGLLPGIFDDFILGGSCKNDIPFFVRKMPIGKLRRQVELLSAEERSRLMKRMEAMDDDT